jgi:hypothetical protein
LPESRDLRLTQLDLVGKPAVWFDPISANEMKANIEPVQGGVGISRPNWDHDAALKIGPILN